MSPADFLARLDLSSDERRSLAALGIPDPVTLAHMIRASREAFVEMIGGAERAASLEQQLRALLTPEEQASLDAPPPPRFELGARLETPPKIRPR